MFTWSLIGHPDLTKIHNLGDHGHTFVSTKPGLSVKDALAKAMKLRKLAPETCAVTLVNDPDKVS